MWDIRKSLEVYGEVYGYTCVEQAWLRAKLPPNVIMAMASESRCEFFSPSYACPLCSGFIVRTYKLWLSHLRHVHSHDANFHVVCGVNSCPRSFRVFSTLYSHVYRSHRHMLDSRDKMPTDVEYVSPEVGEEQATTSSALPTEHMSMDATLYG